MPAEARSRARLALILAAALVAGLSRAQAGEGKPAAVVTPSGRRYAVEISATQELRARGLMYRESLADGRGMLFLFSKPSVEDFWMKNCNFPIDIVWLDEKRKVIFVSARTPPCRDDPCPTYGPKAPALWVLEIPAGAAAKEKITVGSELKFENVPPSPAE
jgi:uncharacterized membrane protein (UPF0127 family)